MTPYRKLHQHLRTLEEVLEGRGYEVLWMDTPSDVGWAAIKDDRVVSGFYPTVFDLAVSL